MAAGRLDLVIVGSAGRPEAGPRGPGSTPILVPNPYKTCCFLRILVISGSLFGSKEMKNKWPARARRTAGSTGRGPQH